MSFNAFKELIVGFLLENHETTVIIYKVLLIILQYITERCDG